MTPLQVFDLTGIGEGTAILVVGMFAILLWASVKFRNPLALVMWGLSVFSFLVVGVYEVQDDIFYLAMLLTVVLIIIGILVRVRR